jgi:predicted XRE-type DNA-binding protein
MKTNRAVTRGSGNIFADLGLPNAEGRMLKARIALTLSKQIKQLDLTQREAAERMGRRIQHPARETRAVLHGSTSGLRASARK